MAAKILEASHPLHTTFITWLGGKEPTKRQARKFLQQNAWAARAMEQDSCPKGWDKVKA